MNSILRSRLFATVPAIPRCGVLSAACIMGCAGIAVADAPASGGPASVGTPSPGLDAEPMRFRFEPAASPVLLGAMGQAQPGTPPGSGAGSDAAADGADASVADWTMGEGADDDSLTVPRTLPVYGEAGSMRLDFRAGYGTDVKDGDQWIAQGGIGLSAFLEDGLALRAELNGAQIQQVEGSEQGINFALLVEWHFLRRDDWSLYVDAGAGILFTTDDVPAGGSSFNFTPQAGLGLTADVFDEARWILGARWHHVSNANTFDENPGRDHIMIYTGLSFPF